MTLRVKENNYAIIRGIVRKRDGSPQNLTGWTPLQLQVKDASGVLLFNKFSTDATQLVITDAVDGEIEIYIQAADTNGKAGTHRYELKGTDPDTHPFTLDGVADFVVEPTQI